MFEGIKRLFDPAAQLAFQVEKAKKAKVEKDWNSASLHFRRASHIVGDADHDLRDSYRDSARYCEEQIKRIEISARRRALGLDGPR
jgi:hypothetical protein